jgi:hypothetical protein
MHIRNRTELVAELQNHVVQFSHWFNEAAVKSGMGITLDPANVVENLKTAGNLRLRELLGALTEYKVHKEQVQTAVGVIAETIANPGSSGIVLGALQSGKTGTAFMTLFAAPVHYLKSKVSYVPLFMTTNQNSHLMQTQKAMRGFFNLYGEISIVSNGLSHSLIDYYAQSGTDLAAADDETDITLHDYAARIVDDIYPGSDIVGSLVQGMTVKRVPGEISKKVRLHCQRARELGHGVMLIVDEPQFGASNQIRRDGTEIQCLLSRAFAEIDEDFFSPATPNFMVGLSATPFDTASLSNLWLVKQKLNSSYVGPNLFGGERIDESVITEMPQVLSFKDLASNKSLEWFDEMPYLIGATTRPSRQTFKPTKIGDDGTKREMNTLERRQKGADLVRTLLDGTLMRRQTKSGQPIGALLRVANNRRITDDVLDAMGIDGPESPYNVIRFYNADGDIKPIIWKATQNDKRPYVVVTVGKGRMGDAFPRSTVMAVDLTHSATDANALLQGVYGRMCGYGKRKPLVIMSNNSKDLIEQYIDNLGATEDFKLSRHVKKSTLEKGRNQHESYFMITDEMIESDHESSPLRAFRADVIKYLEQQKMAEATTSAIVPRRANQYSNLPELMEKHRIVEYVAANSMRLDPELRSPAKIVPVGETSQYRRRDGTMADIAYTLNDAGECMTLVTKVDYTTSANAHKTGRSLGRALSEGLTAKTRGKREALPRGGRGRRDDGILPVITVKKVDGNGSPVSGDTIGRFVFDGFIFHLEEKVQRYRSAVNRNALVEGHAFAAAMTDQEKAEQLALFVTDHMTGKRSHPFLGAMAMADVQRVLANMYDSATHTYEIDEQTITFRDLETDEVDNPYGPAIIDMSDFRNVVSYTIDRSLDEETIVLSDEDEDDIDMESSGDEYERAFRVA